MPKPIDPDQRFLYQSQRWGVSKSVMEDGYMISEPPAEEIRAALMAKQFPITTRRIAIIGVSYYMSKDEAQAIAQHIVDLHNAYIDKKEVPDE